MPADWSRLPPGGPLLITVLYGRDCREQALTKVGAHIEDGPAVPAGGHEPDGLQRPEIGVECRRGEAEVGSQLGGGHGQVELAEEGGTGVTEHISQPER